jgi:ABC-type polysaccharide/polyol phosphate export permease
MIALGLFYVVAFICAIVVFLLFRKLRAQAQEGAYFAMNPNMGIAPFSYANPIVPRGNNFIVYSQNRE